MQGKKYKNQFYENGYYTWSYEMNQVYYMKDLHIYHYIFRKSSWELESVVANKNLEVSKGLLKVSNKLLKLKGVKLYE